MDNSTTPKYTLSMSLSVLKHLGFNLYSNIPAVLSEVVANAYDADAKNVDIEIDKDSKAVFIKDDGHGMSLNDINEKYLNVGYAKRENNEGFSKYLGRPVMGRKGIGKLSLFSIANIIQIYTTSLNEETNKIESHGFELNRIEIEQDIKEGRDYHPKNIEITKQLEIGTIIKLSSFKKEQALNYTSSYLRKRIARRFSVLGSDFKVTVNNEPVTILDRDYFNKVQFIWSIGNFNMSSLSKFQFENSIHLSGTIDGTLYNINGWIGAAKKPSDLKEENEKVNNNKISVLVRGKMAQEDILADFNEGGIYADYLIGEIHADFLDLDKLDDIATSSRQKINEEDDRYKTLTKHVYTILKQIQSKWTKLRNEYNEKVAVEKAEKVNPQLKEWFDSLQKDSRKKYAKKLFATIEGLHFNKHEELDKKKELYKQGILAFEKMKLKETLNELENLNTENDFKLAGIFNDLNDIEANLFYDIASQRVAVIREFQRHLDDNDKEKLLQKYLFDNLWLLNPSWERPTSGTEQMEKTVKKEFDKIDAKLTEQEAKARFDVKYRTAAGKHIIVELKRYKPSYTITHLMIYAQMEKYTKALKKCLKAAGESNPHVESFLIIGGDTLDDETFQTAETLLKTINSKIIFYDTLIEESLKSYSNYIKKQKEVSRIRKIIDEL